MAITKLQPFNLDTTANYTFANIATDNANLGNTATANFFIGSGNNLSNIQGANVTGAVSSATTSGTVTTAAQPNITSVGTLTSLSVTGNITGGNTNLGNLATANFFSGSGNNLSNIQAANISGQVANATVAGTVYTNAQPNITSTGSLTGLTVSNATGVVDFTTTANVTLGAVGNLHISGGTNAYVLSTDGSGTLSWVAQSGGGGISNISNGTSNVNIPAVNGNINFSAAGNANVVVITGTGANISGTANVTGNLIAGNIIAGTGSGGNITNANVISANTFTASGNISAGNASLGNSVVANYFTGNFYGTANSATTAGTVTTAAQPNITSTGSLTGLTVSNATGVVDFTTTANVTLGAVGNLHISGGTNAYVLSTDGSGTLSWVAQSGGGGGASISNGNSNVNIPAANGNINFSATGNANVVVITGTGANISGTANVTGNLTAGNIIAGNGSGGNITNANVISANTFTATGNISAGNANLGNLAIANFFSGAGNNLSNITASNITGQVANALVSGTVYTNAQPNITSVGTLTDLSVSGNGVFGGNLTVNGTLTYINSTTLSISDPIINLQTGPNGAAPVANSGKDVGTALNYYDTSAKISWMGWDVSNAEIAFGSNVSISSEVVTFTSLANIRSGNAQLGNTVTANFFIGSGNNLSNIQGGNVSGQVPNALISSTVYTNAQPNITSVGSLTGLTVSNITGIVDFTTTANVTLGAVGNLHISGGTNGYVLQTDGSGTLSWVAISAGSGISNGTSNISIPAVNGNINLTSAGNTTLVVTGTGANITGNMEATANITAQYFTGNGYYLTGVATNPANISNGTSNVEVSLNGNVTTSVNGNANILVVTGTGINVTGNATIGTGTGGNLIGANIVTANLINAGTVNATANINAQYFTGNGYYLTGVATNPANISNGTSNVEVSLNGNVTTSVSGNANILVVTGTGINVTGNATIGTGTGGNLIGANIVTANLINAGTVNATANINAQYFTGNGYYLTGVATNPANISNGTSNVEVSLNGNVTTSVSGNANILVVTGTGINVTGNATIGTGTGGNLSGANNISANTFTGALANGNSNVNIPSANGNINFSVVGNANVMIITGTGANINGTANITGNVNAPYFIGNGFYLTGVDTSPANISNGTSNVQVYLNSNVTTSVGSVANVFVVTTTGINVAGTLNATGNANVGNIGATGVIATTLGGNLTTNAQPNITSVGSLTGLTVSNVTGVVNFTTTANVTLGAVANLHISGGTNGYVLQTDGSGTLSWVAISAGSGISNGTSNISIPAVNGNVNITSASNTTMVITGTGANITGTANVTGNANIGNIGTAQLLASANITAPQLISNIAVGTAPLIVTSTTQVANLNVATAGTVTTNAQPNITSVGSLTGLTVSNATGVVDFTTTANVTLGAVANLHISGGSSSQFLQTDGSGTLTWAGISSSSTLANGTSEVSIPVVNGNVNVTAAGNANILVVTGTGANISGTLKVSGQSNLGAVGNVIITGGTNGQYLQTNGSGNLVWVGISSSSSLANGNSEVSIPVANSNVNITAVGNTTMVITGTGANITGTLNTTGNANVGNLGTAQVLASANVTAPQLISNIAVGTAPFVVTSTTQVANLNVATAGTVTTNAQPNITSVGSLTGLTVSNATGVVNFTTTANVTLGAVANLHISGGTNGYVLSTDGSGTLSWIASGGGGGGASISNGTSNVNIAVANGNITMGVGGTSNVVVISNTGITALILPRNITYADATSITINAGNTDMAIQVNTQVVGTFTINAPTGTLSDGQKLMFRLQSTNIQTFSWDAVFDGSTDLNLPTTSSGSSKYDYMGFMYNSGQSKWNMISKNFGF